MIRLLDDALVNQIAAGEVVERPASVVKELVENALDAGARTIRVALRDGGRALVKVTDDGAGMDRDDALLCLERHATSKIRTAEDLARVATLGFRGEAIPSIAAVCRFDLLTRTADSDVGTRVRVEGGTLQGVSDAGCAPGTEIECRSLFFNVPVRRKFLRAESTELAHCVEAVVRQALGRPDVDFLVTHDGREVLRAPRAELPVRVQDALGRDATDLMLVDFARGPFAVSGLVSSPRVHRSGHTGATYVYVNGRYVRDAVLHRALAEAYAGLVPRGRHPLVILDVRLDPERVDVNVHPSKVEVRFREPGEVQAAVSVAVRQALQAEGVRPAFRPLPGVPQRVSPDQAALPLPALPDDDPTLAPRPRPAEVAAVRPAWGAPRPTPPAFAADDAPRPSPARAAPAREVSEAAPVAAGRRVLGVAAGRWIVVEEAEGLGVYDGREVLASALRERLADGTSVRLLAPALVDLPRAQADAFEAARDPLLALGLDVARVGPAEVVVRAVPAALPQVDPAALLAEVAPVLSDPAALLGALAAHAAARTPIPSVLPPPPPSRLLPWTDLSRRPR